MSRTARHARRRPQSPLFLAPLALGALAGVAAAQASAPPADGGKPADAMKPDDDGKSCCHSNTAPPSAPRTDRKSVLLRTIAENLKRGQAPFFGEASLRLGAKAIAAITPATPVQEQYRIHANYGDSLMQFGRYEEAIEESEKARAIAEAAQDRRGMHAMLKQAGLAAMRMGEKNNCIQRHNQDSCLFPLREGAIHVDKTGSEKAIDYFNLALKDAPGDASAAWLLNIAHMTVGTYPEGVPEQWRIPPAALESEHAMPRMLDMAKGSGLDCCNRAGGSIMDDFDGDGRLDVLISSMDTFTSLRLFLQREGHRFEEVTEKAGLSGQLGGLQIFHFDANNDGRLDILVQRGGWMGPAGEIPNSLLIQQEDGTFVDRTQEAGIEISAPSQAAAIADIDNDGDLDLFLGYEGNGTRYPSKMFRNRGDGTFEDISIAARVSGAGFVKGCAFGDIDRDGLPDLYVSTMKGDNHLYRNLGGGKFTDVARDLGVENPQDSFSSFFFDYDNDGWLDLYASSYAQCDRVGAMGSWYIEGARRCETNRLYRNDGRGGFVDVTSKVHLDRVAFPMGSSFGDVDNDGFPDIYLATGAPDYSALFPNVLYRNDGGKLFQDVTTATGTGNLQKGHGVSFGDLDGDGDQDLLVQTGGAFKDDTFADALYMNPCHDSAKPGEANHWLTVRLTGVKSNRFGLGAHLKVRIAEPAGERDVCADVGLCSSFGGNSFQEEMGLGQATKIVLLEVTWPASKTVQRFTDVPLDQVIRIVEGRDLLQRDTPPSSP